MRTTLNLPGELINQAMACSHQRTKTAVIITALEELIKKNSIRDLKEFKGAFDLNVDLNVLRNRA